jgi:hypothetical protein
MQNLKEIKELEIIKKKIEAKRKKESFSLVGDIMGEIRKQLGIDVDFFVLAKAWRQEIGINDAELCGYKKGVILAQTQSPAAVNDINIRKKQIIKNLNQYLGGAKIKNIKVTINE